MRPRASVCLVFMAIFFCKPIGNKKPTRPRVPTLWHEGSYSFWPATSRQRFLVLSTPSCTLSLHGSINLQINIWLNSRPGKIWIFDWDTTSMDIYLLILTFTTCIWQLYHLSLFSIKLITFHHFIFYCIMESNKKLLALLFKNKIKPT